MATTTKKDQDKSPEQERAERRVANPGLKQEQADKALEEVRAVHAEQRVNGLYHNRTEISFDVDGVVEGDKDPDQIRIRTVGGRLYVSCSAKEIVLDHDGATDFQRKLGQAFQAVS